MTAILLELQRYQTFDGHVPISEWLGALDSATAGRVLAYMDRMKTGNFWSSRSVGEGVSELKINFGPGYRVYYLRDGDSVVIFLCGGDKNSQQSDICEAQSYAADYWGRR